MIDKWTLPNSSSICEIKSINGFQVVYVHNALIQYAQISLNFLGGDIGEKLLNLPRGYFHLFEHIIAHNYKYIIKDNLLDGNLETPSIRLGFNTGHTYLGIHLNTHYSNITNAFKVVDNIIKFDIDNATFNKIKDIEIKRISTEFKTYNKEARENYRIFGDIIKDPFLNISEDMIMGRESELINFSYNDFNTIKDFLLNQTVKAMSFQTNQEFSKEHLAYFENIFSRFKSNQNITNQIEPILNEYNLDRKTEVKSYNSIDNQYQLTFIKTYPKNRDYKETIMDIFKGLIFFEILKDFLQSKQIGNYTPKRMNTNIYYKYMINSYNTSNSLYSIEETKELFEKEFFVESTFLKPSRIIEDKFIKLKGDYIFNTDSQLDVNYANYNSYLLLINQTPFKDSVLNHIDYIKELELNDVANELWQDVNNNKRVYIEKVRK